MDPVVIVAVCFRSNPSKPSNNGMASKMTRTSYMTTPMIHMCNTSSAQSRKVDFLLSTSRSKSPNKVSIAWAANSAIIKYEMLENPM